MQLSRHCQQNWAYGAQTSKGLIPCNEKQPWAGLDWTLTYGQCLIIHLLSSKLLWAMYVFTQSPASGILNMHEVLHFEIHNELLNPSGAFTDLSIIMPLSWSQCTQFRGWKSKPGSRGPVLTHTASLVLRLFHLSLLMRYTRVKAGSEFPDSLHTEAEKL